MKLSGKKISLFDYTLQKLKIITAISHKVFISTMAKHQSAGKFIGAWRKARVQGTAVQQYRVRRRRPRRCQSARCRPSRFSVGRLSLSFSFKAPSSCQLPPRPLSVLVVCHDHAQIRYFVQLAKLFFFRIAVKMLKSISL